MIAALTRGIRGMAGVVVLVSLLAGDAHAQPPTYLPWDYGKSVRVTQGNNQGPSHGTAYTRYGWDFALPYGSSVRAAAPGRVAVAGWDSTGWGNTIVVCYSDGTCSRYAHLSQVLVRSGQSVAQAQVIGKVGSTGRSSGPHLHYQLQNSRGISLGSRFVEAGVPRTGQVVTSRNNPKPPPPPPSLTFDQVRVYSSNTLNVGAGDSVTAVVTARYTGDWSVPCAKMNLGVRGDVPARFADYDSYWRSSSRVAADGCYRYADAGEYVRWRVPFKVPLETPDGTYLTGIYAPVYNNVAWSDLRIPISLRVSNDSPYEAFTPSDYAAQWVSQTYYMDPLERGQQTTVTVTLQNTGAATWFPDGPYATHLRGINPQDRSSGFIDPDDPRAVGHEGARLPERVDPGETVTITLPIEVQSTVAAGTYKEYFRLVAEHRTWFGPSGIYWPFTVK